METRKRKLVTKGGEEPRKPARSAPCPECGGRSTYRVKGSDLSYCYACRRAYSDVPDAPFDLVLDEWDPRLEALQAAGEILLLRLPEGFVGVCILTGAEPRISAERHPTAARP